MSKKKFSREIEKASEKKLLRMYAERLERDPPYRTERELRKLSDIIPDPVQEELIYHHYAAEADKLERQRFKLLTGYGQCRGSLIVHDRTVIVSCCRDMSALVAYQGAYYQDRFICVPGRDQKSACRSGNSVYLLDDGDDVRLDHCPFCGSSIHEKIDFYEEPEEEGQEE